MKLPKILVNHYVQSANVSESSILEDSPYNIFDNKNLNASKSVAFSSWKQDNPNTSTDMSQPANRLALLNGNPKNSTLIKIEGETRNQKKFRIWWTGN